MPAPGTKGKVMSSKKTLNISCKCGITWRLPYGKGNVGAASFSFQCDDQSAGKPPGCRRYITIEMLDDELVSVSITL